MFMSVKLKFNIFEKIHDNGDFGWFLWEFSMILADFVLYGSVSEPDPKHSLEEVL